MNSNEMFSAIEDGTRLKLREYMAERASQNRPLPVCNVQDLLISTFCRCMDADALIKALDEIEKAAWAARKCAELRQMYEHDNPGEVTSFNICE